jgi:hypothetical protein
MYRPCLDHVRRDRSFLNAKDTHLVLGDNITEWRGITIQES